MNNNVNKLYGVLSNGSTGTNVCYRFTTYNRQLLDASTLDIINTVIPIYWDVTARCVAAELVINACRYHDAWDDLVTKHDAINTYNAPVLFVDQTTLDTLPESCSLACLCNTASTLNPNSSTLKKQRWFSSLDCLAHVGMIILERL